MKTYRILSAVCVFWFIFLCFFHYFSQRPLWGDERFILNNMENQSYLKIFGPLKDSQAFPRVYLSLIKLWAETFGYVVLSLRFFPLIAMLLAFFAWKKIYQKALPSGMYSLALFSLSSVYCFSYYAAELKQYSLDVLIAALFCLYLGYQSQLTTKEFSMPFILATLLLPFTLFLSYAGFLFFWIVSYNFFLAGLKNKKAVCLFIAYALLSVSAVITVYFIDLRHNLSAAGLFSYWNDYFISTESWYAFLKSFGDGVRKIATWWFGNTDFLKRAASFLIPFFIISLFTFGFKALKASRLKVWDIDALGLVIFLELLALGILKKYPFTGERIILFFAPFVFYYIIRGIYSLRRLRFIYFFFLVSYMALVLGSAVNSFVSFTKLYN